MISRRRVVLSALGAAAIGAYPFWLEPRWLDVTRRRVRLPRPGLDRPVRVLHLSDLHASVFVSLRLISDAISRGLAAKPDVVCLTGDFVSGPGDTPARADYARVLRRLSAAAPTFAVLGNHDGGTWASGRYGWTNHRLIDHILEDSQIETLHNRSQVVEVRGQKLGFVGVGDYWSEEVDAARAFSGLDPKLPAVLLAHNPDTKELCSAHSWDLMLSGHTHGGQIVVPFYGTPFRPVQDTRYLAGLKHWGSRQIHVTRGVGNLLGVRLNCRPEVSLLEVG